MKFWHDIIQILCFAGPPVIPTNGAPRMPGPGFVPRPPPPALGPLPMPPRPGQFKFLYYTCASFKLEFGHESAFLLHMYNVHTCLFF